MTFPWENKAKRCEPMPDGLKQSEQLAYQSIALLAARYRLGGLSDEQAVADRKKIDQRYLIDAANEGYIQWTVDVRRRVEMAVNRFRREPSIANANVMADVLDGFVRG
ncbi:MAG: hypothetical protein IIX99_01550 [Oscillospiraceae bacterium]|nr:hypothetical protein [Oscillospiraceae bacterium]